MKDDTRTAPLPVMPREIDPAATFEALVQWIGAQAQTHQAPGLIVGVSGTDSIIAFLAAAEAFRRMGKPERVIGVHYGPEVTGQIPKPDHDHDAGEHGAACMLHEFNWVAGEIFPWLAQRAPGARLELNSSEGYDDDNIRWGRLFSRAVRDTGKGDSLLGSHYFPVGTRNATEDYLGTYSQISKAVSLQPLVGLYKSEILKLCEYLGVPKIAMDKSRQVDCNCGRFDVAANHIEEVDAYIMVRQGVLSRDYLKGFAPEMRAKVMEYVLEEKERNNFRTQTPYRPAQDLAVTIKQDLC